MKNSELKKVLALVSKLKPNVNQISILENLKFENGIMSYTDLTTTIQVATEFKGHGLMPLVELKKICAKVPNDTDIHLTFVGMHTMVELNGVKKFEFKTQSWGDYPMSPIYYQSVGVELLGADLVTALKYVCQDELRYSMRGALIDSENIVATDAHRMFFRKHHCTTDIEVIIPESTLKLIDPKETYLLQSCQTDRNYWLLSCHHSDLSFRAIDAKFPNYKAVIPDNENEIIFENKSFAEQISLALLAANKITSCVELIFNGVSKVKSCDLDRKCTFESNVPFCTNLNDIDIRIGFNANFLIDTLKDLGSNVSMKVSTPNKAAIFNNEFLIMPIMLS